MLAGTEITAFVDALAHRGTVKPVQWFLQKYGVSVPREKKDRILRYMAEILLMIGGGKG